MASTVKENLANRFLSIAETIHLRIFGHAMSDEMRKFLSHLSWSFFGGIVAAGIMFVVNILAGRWLGPEEYGRYSLLLLMSQVFSIPMILGMDISIVRTIAQQPNSPKNGSMIRHYVGSAVFLVAVSLTGTCALLFLFRISVATLFSAPVIFVSLATLLGIVTTLKTFSDGITKGFHRFHLQALVRVVESVSVILIFFHLYFLFRNYLSIVMATAIPALGVFLVYGAKFWKLVGATKYHHLATLLRYAKFVVIGSALSLILGYGDRYVVNRYLGVEELGSYSAYYTATISVAGQLGSIISNVFFPIISGVREKLFIVKKLDRIFSLGFIPTVGVVFLFGLFVLFLFGRSYQLNTWNLFLFSVIASLQLFVVFYANIVNAHSEKTYFWGLSLLSMRSVFYVMYIAFIVFFNLVTTSSILIGLLVNYIVDIINLRYILRKYA